MPELPEVQTTVNGINEEVKGLTISDIWTSYNSPFHHGKNNIKNPDYFKYFRKNIIGSKILRAERDGKNVLIHLSNGYTILAHMKMTGHFMAGKYKKHKDVWLPDDTNTALSDPYNRHIRLMFIFTNKTHLAFADTRKFAKVFIFEFNKRHEVPDLKVLGPDPMDNNFSYKKMRERLLIRENWKIKQALLDQKIIAGIGNIYSDEMLWVAGIHPLSVVTKIPTEKLKALHLSMRQVLKKGVNFGGDSTSDYRNIHGVRGKFQHKHNVYRRTGQLCPKKDGGTIQRIKVAGRSGHFCPVHQKLYV
jgi:formamidopyrimidine-DNA glycosylase